MSVIDAEPLALPANSKPTSEAKLLIQEAADVIGPVKNNARRAESGVYIRRWTGERLMREEPRRFKLIVSMRNEGLSWRQICRAAHVDSRTADSVVRLAQMSMPALKSRLTSNFGHLARMTSERLLEEVGTMNQAQLAVTAGIATDKFNLLTGDPNMVIQHNVTVSGNIFDRINTLAKTIQATVIEPPQLTNTAT